MSQTLSNNSRVIKRAEKLKAQFSESFPGERIIVVSKASGQTAPEPSLKGGSIKFSKLKKEYLILTDCNIKYGKISIPLSEIEKAGIYVISKPVSGVYMKLHFHTPAEGYYSFRMNFDESWLQQSLFPFSLENQQSNVDLAGNILRFLALAILGYIMYKAWGK